MTSLNSNNLATTIGNILTTNISNSINWHDPTNNKLEVKGSIRVRGRDILAEIDEIKEMLCIISPDLNMEEKYPRLKEIRDQYKRELDKYKTFEMLK